METLKTNRAGFTLVELLVVIAVLAILGSLLIPVLGSVKRRSHEATCVSNMRQIGVALQLYATDHGQYPSTTHTSQLNQAWIFTIADYLGNVDEVRICPADPDLIREDRLEAGGTSYILNSFVFVQERGPFGNPVGPARNRPSMIPNPAQTILAFNASDLLPPGPTSDHTHSRSWTGWNAMLRDIQPNRHGGSEHDPTSGSANYLYADGHVESIPAIEIKQKIEAGENIAEVK